MNLWLKHAKAAGVDEGFETKYCTTLRRTDLYWANQVDHLGDQIPFSPLIFYLCIYFIFQ